MLVSHTGPDLRITGPLPVDQHEVMVTQHLLRPSSLQEALDKEHEANQVSQRALSVDKQLVGPLGSACNRTCSGNMWISRYLSALSTAPEAIRNLVRQEPEEEIFRFGDGGVQTSKFRYRLLWWLAAVWF